MTTNVPVSLPERLADAEGELPEEIEKAIEAFEKVVSGRTKLHQRPGGPTRDYDIADAAYDTARAALTATILARLTAAESERDPDDEGIARTIANMLGYEWDELPEAPDGTDADPLSRRELISVAMAVWSKHIKALVSAALARAERAEKALEAIRAHEAEKAKHLVADRAAQNIAYLQANIAQMERFMKRGEEDDPIGFRQWASRRDEFQRELDAALAHPATAEET